MSCTSRFFVRIAFFIHRIINTNYLSMIKDKLTSSNTLNNYNLRSKANNTSVYYQNNCRTKHGEHRLSIFMVKFINTIVQDSIHLDQEQFKKKIIINLSDNSSLFLTLF
jgi:hypothetical protein